MPKRDTPETTASAASPGGELGKINLGGMDPTVFRRDKR
jgi:hypothetical protein